MNIDDPVVRRFIRRAMVARIATLSSSGRPSVTPLYFNVVGDHIWLGTASWTLAARQVSANPCVSLLFQHEHDHGDGRILRLAGRAIVQTDETIMRRSYRYMALKYVLSPGGLLNQLTHRHLAAAVRQYRTQSSAKGLPCVLDVTPEQIEFLNERSAP